MDCEKIYNEMSQYIIKIETPACSGTGFLCFKNNALCGIATAYHVVKIANELKHPIKLTHYDSHNEGTWILPGLIHILFNPETDSAILVVENKFLPFIGIFDNTPELLQLGNVANIGSRACWMGFPAIQQDTLCIFTGIISSRIQNNGTFYLIDGVSIHGVSGGPVIIVDNDLIPRVIGIVNMYIPNTSKGNSLPGLLYARDVLHFLKVIHDINSLDELNNNKQEIENKL